MFIILNKINDNEQNKIEKILKNFRFKISKKNFFKNPRNIYMGNIKLRALPLFVCQPCFTALKHHRFNVLKTFWIFWKLMNIHRVHIFQKPQTCTIFRKIGIVWIVRIFSNFVTIQNSQKISAIYTIQIILNTGKSYPQDEADCIQFSMFTCGKLFAINWQGKIYHNKIVSNGKNCHFPLYTLLYHKLHKITMQKYWQ